MKKLVFLSLLSVALLTKPWFSAQFHPEAASGPTDTEFLFDEFVKLL